MQVLNVLDSYVSRDAAEGALGLHRVIEALKHMFAVRMNLGDPDFENINSTVSDMLSVSFAKSIRDTIFDNTTFPSEYYMHRFFFVSYPIISFYKGKTILILWFVAGGVSLGITGLVISVWWIQTEMLYQ